MADPFVAKTSTPYDPRASDKKQEGKTLDDAAVGIVEDDGPHADRIAKVIARAGICSRRDAEKLVSEGRVTLDGELVTTPATKVGTDQIVCIDQKPLAAPEAARLWRYHKPAGLVTTHKDPQDRPTVFANLPKHLPRVVSVGRLDFNSEGLLLLTNDGGLARVKCRGDDLFR